MSRKRIPVAVQEDKETVAKTISMPPDLLKWADDQADASGRNRSAWIAWALNRIKDGKPVPLEDVTEESKEEPKEEAIGPLMYPYSKKLKKSGKASGSSKEPQAGARHPANHQSSK
jgi:hypothetical protein